MYRFKDIFKVILWIVIIIEFVDGLMLRKECPTDEVHRSCAFYEEYTCWLRNDRLERRKLPLKRLSHCTPGCYCRKGLVRNYPEGVCIIAAACRDRNRQEVIRRPPDF